MSIEARRKAVEDLMEKYQSFGAMDTEPRHTLNWLIQRAQEGKPAPFRHGQANNPWELYSTMPGWSAASHELIEAGLKLHDAIQGREPARVLITVEKGVATVSENDGNVEVEIIHL